MQDFREYCKSVKSQLDVRSLLSHLNIEVNKHGMLHCISPLHEDKHPSMWSGQEACGCYACGYYADCFEIIQTVKGCSFIDALNFCADYAGIPHYQFQQQSEEEIKTYQAKKEKEQLLSRILSATVQAYQKNESSYLIERGISSDIIKLMNIGATNGFPDYLRTSLENQGFQLQDFSHILLNKYTKDFFQNAVIVPIYKDGKCIDLYARKTDGSEEYKHLYLKRDGFKELGIEPDTSLYNFDNARKYKEIFIYESIIDCLTALSHGIENSTGIYGTQGLRDAHLKQLKSARTEKVNLVMDGDTPGRKAAIKHGYRIEDIGIIVKIIILPDEQDPNDYFQNGGTRDKFLSLPQYTPLQVAIRETNPDLKGEEFLKAIEPILEKIGKKDPLIWKDELEKIKEHFHSKPSINELKVKVKQIAKNNDSLPEISLETIEKEKSSIQSIFQDETYKDMKVPEGWAILEQGISQMKMKLSGEPYFTHVSHYPIIITETARNIDEGNEFLTLKYKKEEKIYTIRTERKTISEFKSITELSQNGFPVNSANAKQIIRYLEDFEASNIAYLKKSYITHGFGHKYDSKGNPIFFLPLNAYNTKESITFHGKGPGDNQFAIALQPKGNVNDWTSIIKTYAVPYDRVMFALYAGFAACLLKFFGCTQSFVIHSYGNRSCGKTTQNQMVASIYGDPAKLLFQWKYITEVAAEQLAGLFNGIPIFLEDSQNAEEKKISEMVYMIANGVGKARGYKTGGLQKTLFWITNLFSTGEKAFFELIKKGGADARNLSMYGSPFTSENDPKIGEMTREIKRLVHENYGTAIYVYLDYIYSRSPKKLKSYYDDAYKFITSQVANAGEIHRHIDYFSSILAAGLLAEEVFHFGSNPIEVCKTILRLFEEEGFIDAVSESKDDVVSWVNSNDNLYDISGATYEEKDGYSPRHGVKKPGEYIAIFPHILKDFLVKQGYSPSMILKGWKDREWIEVGKDEKRTTVVVSFRNKSVRMVKIYWEFYSQS